MSRSKYRGWEKYYGARQKRFRKSTARRNRIQERVLIDCLMQCPSLWYDMTFKKYTLCEDWWNYD